MSQFAGTWRLVRLALRRDRIKLTIWLLIIIGMTASMPAALNETYGTPEARESYAAAIGVSIVGRMFGALLDDTSLGSILMVESFTFVAVLVAVMNTLLVTRHTRQNEEAGSMELIQSARVGRFASLTAVLIVAVFANFIAGVGIATVLGIGGLLDPTGNAFYGVAQAAIGMSFAAIAAIMTQLFTSSRMVNVALSLSIGIMYLLRGLGDGFAQTINGRLEALWPSWLSPMGWGELTYPYTRQETWWFALFAGFIVLAVGAAFAIMARRDVGVGVFSERPGPARASGALTGTLGLAWRLQRSMLIGWAIVMVVFGAMFGSLAQQLEALVTDNPVLEQYVIALGGEGKLVEAFYGTMLGLAALTAVAYVVQSLQRLHTEEISGRLESVLAVKVNKYGWMVSHAGISLIGSSLLLAIAGASTGFTAVLVEGREVVLIGEFTLAALAYLPALAVCWSLVLLTFSLKPWLVAIVGWSVFGLLMGISQIGAMLNLSDAIMDISPFRHIPAAPVETITAEPLVILSLIACVMAGAGFMLFRRRSITTN